MEWVYLGIIIFIFVLAAFDLWVGVSNDAVNFLNSSVGSKAASFRTLLIIAAVGVFAGCLLSNGMMDIARHGIFTPQYFSFHDVMYIYMAVMVTDIVLLDVFNNYGMPTSTTVSMVFELLGASFAFVVIHMATGADGLAMGDYLNTSKALEVIFGIFLSVPIAFVFGSLIQWIVRLIFSFDIVHNLRYKIGIFAGFAITMIFYFMLFKGLKDLSFMSTEVKDWIHLHTLPLLGGIFVVSAILMQVVHALRINVFRLIVLLGTFALATAFAGNDLVNFIGVPLAGFSAFQDFTAHASGVDADSFMMGSLGGSATTPIYFLAGAGVIMVFALATSKKARKVVQTEVGLSRKNDGEEMFGSSRAARSIVRWGTSVAQAVQNYTPSSVARFINKRFTVPENLEDNGAAYDLLRASVNLSVASMLIALGTSLKLPLSTTFVTFMVAMGSSLADRAWGRETAVFRITGVLSVTGGWFITACVAFVSCFVVAMAMNFGGFFVVTLIVIAAIYAIIHSQIRFNKKEKEAKKEGDVLFSQMLHVKDRTTILPMLERHIAMSVAELLDSYRTILVDSTDALFGQHYRTMRRTTRQLSKERYRIKSLRRRELICLRRAMPATTAVRLSTDFHLIHNALRQLYFCLKRLVDPASEHLENNFTPIDPAVAQRYITLRDRGVALMEFVSDNLRAMRPQDNGQLAEPVRTLRHDIYDFYKEVSEKLQGDDVNINSLTLALHLIQETEQMVVELRHVLRAIEAYDAKQNMTFGESHPAAAAPAGVTATPQGK